MCLQEQVWKNVAMESIVGDGNNTFFWTDNWLQGSSIATIAPNILAQVPKAKRNKGAVREALLDDQWTQDMQGALDVAALAELIRSLIILEAWMSWKQHNDMMFNGASPNVQRTMSLITMEMHLWSLAGAKELARLPVAEVAGVAGHLVVCLGSIADDIVLLGAANSANVPKLKRLASGVHDEVFNMFTACYVDVQLLLSSRRPGNTMISIGSLYSPVVRFSPDFVKLPFRAKLLTGCEFAGAALLLMIVAAVTVHCCNRRRSSKKAREAERLSQEKDRRIAELTDDLAAQRELAAVLGEAGRDADEITQAASPRAATEASSSSSRGHRLMEAHGGDEITTEQENQASCELLLVEARGRIRALEDQVAVAVARNRGLEEDLALERARARRIHRQLVVATVAADKYKANAEQFVVTADETKPQEEKEPPQER
ncbi:hypothetical protein PR202_gb17843 [Eleusine coracana subsp. coracana]|uniref:Uncharacterized protein n=1 Tax=Eleusine coracana subsp. coracana TaxID=191504 RepID=A0AAV5F4M4_ELECO|nr:hypothetical protein PR202_gb17843 [Eleusine coracana subsp. coracana]